MSVAGVNGGLWRGGRLELASSSESLELAWAVQENLDRIADVDVDVWDQTPFRLSRTILSSITSALDDADYGIFILNPDDVVEIRAQNLYAARDNVIFELGLFVARLGVEKCFILVPAATPTLRIPTDLVSVTMGHCRIPANGKLKSATGPFCNQVRTELASWTAPPRAPVHTFHERFRSVDWGEKIRGAAFGLTLAGTGVRCVSEKHSGESTHL